MDESIDILLKNLNDPDNDLRRAAAEKLSAYPVEDAVDKLVASLSDINRSVAEASANSLLSIRGALVVKKLIPLLDSEKPNLRNFSFEILSEIGDDSIFDIIELLKSDDHDLRKFSVDILGELCNPAAVTALISSLEDSNVNVAAGAAESLGKINDTRAIPKLVEKLEGDVWMQCSVIKSLSMFHDRRAAEGLYLILPKLKGMSLFTAISALGNIGTKTIVPILLDLLKEQNKAFKSSIISSIERIIEREGNNTIGLDVGNIDINELLELLLDQQIQTKLSTIKVLGWLKNESCVKHLVREFIETENSAELTDYKGDIKHHIFNALININPKDISCITEAIESNTTPDEVKAELIDIIGKTKNSSGINCLLKMKNSANTLIKRVLARSFGEIDHPDSINALLTYLKDADGHTRGLSARSLGRLKVKSVLDDLISLFDDEFKNIREDAASALAQIGTKSVIDKLKNLLETSPDCEKKRLSLLALGKIADPESVSILSAFLSDSDPDIRKITIEAISERYARNYYDKLINMIDDDNNDVRVAAIRGLSKVDPAIVVPHLVNALKQDKNMMIRYHIVEALGDLKATEAANPLIDLLNDKSTIVVLSAIEALGKINDERAIGPLKELYENDDKDIVATAKEVVGNIENQL